MLYSIVKVTTSALLIVAISEVSKRATTLGALLASLPLVSLLAMMWLYIDTGDRSKVADLASSIFWLVLPSLALFLILPVLLRAGRAFWPSLAISSVVTAALYLGEVWLLRRIGIEL